MKIRNLYILLSGLLLFTAMSCEDKANDWSVDDSHSRLFRPSNFGIINAQPTSVQVTFLGVNNATKYIFELSKDSLEFNEIIRTFELSADTLIPLEDATSVVERVYRVGIENLERVTRYSVRMKAIGETSESGYMQVTFMTPREQIFTGTYPSIGMVTLTWTPEAEVTHILYWESGNPESIEPNIIALDETQITEGIIAIAGLTPGVEYFAQINNHSEIRGVTNFTPLGIPESEGYTLRLSDDSITGAQIRDTLTACLGEGHNSVALVFEGDKVYDSIDRFDIPAGIQNLYLIGDLAYGQTNIPELFLCRVNILEPMNAIKFQNLDVNARLNSANYIFDVSSANGFKTIDFEGCTIRNVGRTVVRPNNGELDIERISFNNCILNTVGASGYGCINMGTDVPIGLISFTNSTVIEFGTDRLMHLKGGVRAVVVDQVTLYNYKVKATQVFRFDKPAEGSGFSQQVPGSVKVSNCVIAGTNAGVALQAGNSADDIGYLFFENCYITSDIIQSETRPFTGATTLQISSEDLFVDPQNGDFHTKKSYEGSGIAGDPRWW